MPLNLGTPDLWERREAENWAGVYASTHSEVIEANKNDELIRDALRRWLDLNNEEEIIDGETGLGVNLGKARRMTTWDLQSAPVTLLVDLAARGVLTVSTSAFDALVKAGGGSDLDAAKKYRIDGESARPVQVVTSE